MQDGNRALARIIKNRQAVCRKIQRFFVSRFGDRGGEREALLTNKRKTAKSTIFFGIKLVYIERRKQ